VRHDDEELIRMAREFIGTLSEEQKEDLKQGRSRLKIAQQDTKKKPHPTVKGNLNEADTEAIVARLQTCSTRDEGKRTLLAYDLSRDDYRCICQRLDLMARKQDTVDILQQRIIEATIGFRLSSRAIRGERL
jgi:hypothetical protein